MKNIYLKKGFTIIIALYLFFIFLGKLVFYFVELNNLSVEAKFYLQALIKLFVLGIVLRLTFKQGIVNFKNLFAKNLVFVIICLVLSYLSIKNSLDFIDQKKILITDRFHFSYFISKMATGLFEEFFCRVLIFSNICTSFKFKTFSLVKQIFLSSTIFGLLHISNLLNSDYDVISVINQIFMAIIIGVLFHSLLLRFHNIIFVSVIHCLIDYFGVRNSQLFKILTPEVKVSLIEEFTNTIFTLCLFSVIIFPISYVLLKNRKNNLFK